MRKKFGFVILHYCSLDDTKRCVDSIREKCAYNTYHIAIVDNASPNGTGKNLKEIYQQDNDCTVLLNDKNLGFSRGNNVGFRYLRDQYDCDFICVMNSDVFLIDNSFEKMIEAEYNNKPFYVLGPDIITANAEQCNPMGNHRLTYKETKMKVCSLRIQLLLNSVNADELIHKVVLKIKKREKRKNIYRRNTRYENVKLHGCCWIFSKDYIKEYDGLNEGTFLYLEEDLLYLIMMKDHKRMVYSPKVHVYHAEDGSTNYIHKGRKKRRFILMNHLKSMQYIHEYLKNGG